jgi:hypothetical protein
VNQKNGQRPPLPPIEPPCIDGRSPPHDLAAEGAVIAAVLIDPAALDEVLWLRADHFYAESHRRIWEALVDCRARGIVIDVVTVAARLRDTEKLGSVGGEKYLGDLLDAAPDEIHVEAYARIVEEKCRVRRTIALCQRIAAQGYLDYGSASGYVSEAELALSTIARTQAGKLARRDASQIFAPKPTELPWVCRGLRLIAGRVALVAGYAHSGKTLAVQALELSVALGKSIWGGFEVNRSGMVAHMNWDQPQLDTEIRWDRLALGMGIEEPARSLQGKLENIQYPKVFLDDPSAYAEIRAVCRDATLVVLDALTGAAGSIDENSPAIGRALYQLGEVSESTGCAIIVIHHAGKPETPMPNGRKAAPKDPLHALRGSSSIAGAGGSVFIMAKRDKAPNLYNMVHARTPTIAGSKLDPFALRFVDEKTEGKSRDFWPVRVEYVPGDELRAQEVEADAEKHDPNAAFEQLTARVLELVKLHPGENGSALHGRAGKVHPKRFFAALSVLETHNRIIGEPGPRRSTLWRAT